MHLQTCPLSVRNTLSLSFPMHLSHFWLTSMCNSKPSLCPHCRVMCTCLSKPAALWALAPLFNSWGKCDPASAPGRELSSGVGMQRVLQQACQGYQRGKTGIMNMSHVAVPTGVCGAMPRLENKETVKTYSFRISALLAYLSILCVILFNMTWLKLVLDSGFSNRQELFRII